LHTASPRSQDSYFLLIYEMNLTNDILRLRLKNHLLVNKPFKSVYEVVKWMGAVQAQDYYGSLWAIGLRMKSINEAMVEKAIDDRQIVRSWPMRGTLHFTAPEDLRWMLNLLAPRIIKKATLVYTQAGLNAKIFNKASTLLVKEFGENPIMTREEIYGILEKSKIPTSQSRGLHILGWMALNGIICQSSRKGKQSTFALLDYWIPGAKAITEDEALAKLAMQYFKSHGPATIQDFCWWTGLTQAEAKKAIGLVEANLHRLNADTNFLYAGEAQGSKSAAIILIPSYDEYSVGYKDRSALLEDVHISSTGHGIFSPCILLNGKIAGTWKRTKEKNEVKIQTSLFNKVTEKERNSLEKAVSGYKNFING
jgi:hypothetical protein